MKRLSLKSMALPMAAAAITATALALPAWGEGDESDGGAAAGPRHDVIGMAIAAGGRGELGKQMEAAIACMEEQGLGRRDGPGSFHLGPADRRRFEEAAEQCDLPLPHLPGGFHPGAPGAAIAFAGPPGSHEMVQLTDEELEAARERFGEFQQCMENQNVELPEAPVPPEPGEVRPGSPGGFAIPLPPPLPGERDEIRAAEEECGGPPEIVISRR